MANGCTVVNWLCIIYQELDGRTHVRASNGTATLKPTLTGHGRPQRGDPT